MIQTMATEVAIQLEAEEAMVEETGLLDKMSASSVGVQGIGLEIALQLVAEAVVEVYYPHVLGSEELGTVGIVLVEIVIDTWMIAMMEDAMVIGIVLTAETTSMVGVIAMLVTGTQPMGIDFAGDRFSGSDRYAQNGKDRGYDRDGGPRGGNDSRYGGSGGPSRNDRSYKSRPGPYDHRPSRGGRPSSFERY
ncbi:hypothetical protein OIU84_020532 [Salix udensis]|uniref:Uncharacterized protein n=1 Tax=Salix udensis TaxID=889485 RepID=A0AAD6KSJ0_9ROSI|nr:hypothetical protein OIU84_020532 [Salix udensis]